MMRFLRHINLQSSTPVPKDLVTLRSSLRPVKQADQKHLDVLREYLGMPVEILDADPAVPYAFPYILSGYQAGKPPKVGLLLHYKNTIYFCQKSRLRETFMALPRYQINAVSISRNLKLTRVSISAHQTQLEFVTKENRNKVSAFIQSLSLESVTPSI